MAAVGGTTYAHLQTHDAGGYQIWKSFKEGATDNDVIGSNANQWLYDEAGRLKSIPGHITGLTYNARGQVTVATYANGVTTTNTYNDQRGWLTGVSTINGATVLQSVAITRDDAGRITAITRAGQAADSWTYVAACPGVGRGRPRPAGDRDQRRRRLEVGDVHL